MHNNDVDEVYGALERRLAARLELSLDAVRQILARPSSLELAVERESARRGEGVPGALLVAGHHSDCLSWDALDRVASDPGSASEAERSHLEQCSLCKSLSEPAPSDPARVEWLVSEVAARYHAATEEVEEDCDTVVNQRTAAVMPKKSPIRDSRPLGEEDVGSTDDPLGLREGARRARRPMQLADGC